MSTVPNIRTSLDIGQERIVLLNDMMMSHLSGIVKILGDPRKVNEAKLKGVVAKISKEFLPSELRAEIKDPGRFESELTQVLKNFTERMNGKVPTDEDTQLLVADLMSVFMTNQAFGLVNSKALDKEIFKGYMPEIIARYPSITMQKVVGIAIWFASAITSWLGLTHYIGIGATWLGDKFAVNTAAMMSPALRHTLSIIGSGAISQVVQKFKEAIEHRANEGDVSGLRAFGKLIKQKATIMGAPILAAAALLMAFDVGTNVNGIVMAVAGRHSVNDQLKGAKGQIDERTKAIREQMDKLGLIPDKVNAEIQEMLIKEESGTSETGKASRGPMYHAKRFIYQEDGESEAFLNQGPISPPAANGEKGKEAAVETPDEKSRKSFRTELRDAIQASGVIDGKPLKNELEERIAEQTDVVLGIIEEVEKEKKALDAGAEIETTQKQLDKIIARLESAISVVNKDLPKELNAHMGKFSNVNTRLVEIAKKQVNEKGESRYPNIKPDEVKEWKLPDLKMDNAKITIEKMKYLGFEDLWKVMKEKWNPTERSLFMALFLALGVLSSYMDMISLPWTRKAFNKDRKEAEEKHTRWVKHFEEKMVHLLGLTVNSGPFSQYFKPGNAMEEGLIRQALDMRIKELSKLPKERRGVVGRFLFKILPLAERHELKGKTEISVQHNARVAAIRRIMESPEEIEALLIKVLPGLRIVKNPEPGDSFDRALRNNIESVKRNNSVMQAHAIQGLINEISEIQKKIGEDTPIADWEKVWSSQPAFQERIKKFSDAIDENNTGLLGKLEKAYSDLEAHLQKILFMIIEREVLSFNFDENTDDGELSEKDAFIAKSFKILSSIKSDNNIDTLNAQENAKKSLESAQENIKDVRLKKAQIQQGMERMRLYSSKSAEAYSTVSSVRDWQNRVRGATKEKLASEMAALLGFRYLIEPLAKDEKIEKDSADELEASFVKLMKNIGFYDLKNQDEKDNIQEMKNEITAAMNALREYFP